MRSIALISLVLTGVLTVSGCGTTTKKLKPAELQSFKASVSTDLVWNVDIGNSPKFEVGVGQFIPAVSGDFAYAASSKGTVTRVSISKGRVLWRTQVNAGIVAGVAVGTGASQGFSAVVTDKSEIVVIDNDGKIARRIALGGVVLEPPVLIGERVIARLADNRVAAWNFKTGERSWILQRTLPPLVLHGQSGMRAAAVAPEESISSALGESDLLINMPGARLLWVDASTGAVRWESQIAAPRGANEVERISDLLGRPTVHGAEACAAAYQTHVACFDASSGRKIWGQDLAAGTPLAASTDLIFVADSQSRLFALNRKDGVTNWSSSAFQLRGLSNPLVYGRALWAADQFGYLHVLNLQDGKTMARLRLSGGPLSGAMLGTSQGVVVQTQGGQLMLIRLKG
jgi:outer membrane protein assembly factor BamB